MTKKQKKILCRIIISSVILILIQFLPFKGGPKLVIYLIDYIIIGYDILKKAFKGILNLRPFDENFLMAVATIGAFSLAIIEKSDDCNEAIAVMLFYQIGELFQSYAVAKSRKNVAELMDIRPDYANIETETGLEKVDPDEVEVGKVIVVQPGEKVPIDGIIVAGKSSIDTSALTGESLPRGISEGEEIISGSINMTSVLKIRTTKEFGESTVSKMLELVENASSRKSKSEEFISKFARYYTPFVCISAMILALIPALVRMLILNLSPNWSLWIYRALTFLVISCPCALVISIPLSFFAGIGGASHEGILIKGSNYLESLSKTKIMVFDKTGTLTRGVFEVTDISPNQIHEDLLLEYAALAECASSHPISKSLQKAYNKPIDRKRVADIEEISGHGITARVDGNHVAIGNDKLMKKLNIDYNECQMTGTIIYVSIDNNYAGHIVISDIIKDNSLKAVESLKKIGIDKTIMLTGDVKSVADKTAEKLNIDTAYSELLPLDKLNIVEQLIEHNDKKTMLAFAGDGINDAAVLARADIGIAMGAMGSDAAIEAADVVLMDDDPLKISKAIKISKKCIGIVYQNIVFALFIKAACLILATIGMANMWLAIFADVGVMIIAVLNAIRALNVKKL